MPNPSNDSGISRPPLLLAAGRLDARVSHQCPRGLLQLHKAADGLSIAVHTTYRNHPGRAPWRIASSARVVLSRSLSLISLLMSLSIS
jgi:hypothetical protein